MTSNYASVFTIDTLDVQIRARLYFEAHNLGIGDKWISYDFFSWIEKQWSEYAREHDVTEGEVKNHDHFNDWLQRKIKDARS